MGEGGVNDCLRACRPLPEGWGRERGVSSRRGEGPTKEGRGVREVRFACGGL
jgi:hypothetical protein